MKSKGERLGWASASKAAADYIHTKKSIKTYDQASKGKNITLNLRKISKEELEANRRSCYQYLIP